MFRSQRAQSERKFRLVVFYAVAFVDDDVIPADFSEPRTLDKDEFIRSQTHIESMRQELRFDESFLREEEEEGRKEKKKGFSKRLE